MKIFQRKSRVLLVWLASLIFFATPVSADLIVFKPTCRPGQDPNTSICVETSQESPIPVNEKPSLVYIVSGVVVAAVIVISIISLRRCSK